MTPFFQEQPSLRLFKDKLVEFATKQRRGIRNPFVIVPVAPHLERRLSGVLQAWQPEEVEVHALYLDRIFPHTEVFQTVTAIPEGALDKLNSNGEDGGNALVEHTLQDNLGREIVDTIVGEHGHFRSNPEQIVLLLNLGSLYPFVRASELLDELDRQGVQATVGLPFPGRVYNGKLSFFGEEARHYYPAHRIDKQIQEAELQ